MALEPFDDFLRDLRQNLEDPIYLNNNEEVIFDWLLEEGVKPHRISQVAEILQSIIPHYLRQPCVKPWEQLLKRYLAVLVEGKVEDHYREAQLIFSQYLLSNAGGQKVLDALAEARKLAMHNPNLQVRIDAYVEVLKANVFDANNRKLESHRTYNELRKYAEKTENPETRAVIFYALGMYHLRHYELDKAMEFATETFRLEHESLARQRQIGGATFDTHTRMIEARIAMGIIHRHRENLLESDTILHEALYWCSPEIHSYHKGIIKHELAWISYKTGQYKVAVETMMEAKEIFESLNHQALIASSDHSLGIMLIEEKNYKRALVLLGNALETYTDLTNYSHIVDVHHAIGYVHLRSAEEVKITAEDLTMAESQFRRAEQMAYQYLQKMQERKQYHLGLIAEDKVRLEKLKKRFESGDHPSHS